MPDTFYKKEIGREAQVSQQAKADKITAPVLRIGATKNLGETFSVIKD